MRLSRSSGFSQTKIDGAPDTIFVDQEVVAIIRAQQQWAHDHVRALLRDNDAPPPRYLFLAMARNNRGRHPYPKTTLRGRMQQLGELADIRDSQGRRAAVDQRAPLPPHPRDQPDQRGCPGARGPAIPRAPVAQDDDALLQDAARDARAGVPAPQEDHRRRRKISISTRATCSR